MVPKVVLNNGVEMPQLGLGTFLIPNDILPKTIAQAYELGYRQFDTAWRYKNEKTIAQTLKNCRIKREDVFITTKVNADALYFLGFQEGKKKFVNLPRRTVRMAIEESFKNLGTDYIDLFLVHYPWPMYRKMWEVLTDLYRQGRIRAIGVSNMLPPHIEALKEVSDIVPAINQFEISPLNTQKSNIAWCQDRDIQVTAMSTFSHFRSIAPRKEILENPLLEKIASIHNKSVVQVVLRWLMQQGVLAIPKTWNENHLIENIEIFDFKLNEEEMTLIDSLDKGHFLNYHPYSKTARKCLLGTKYYEWEGFYKFGAFEYVRKNPEPRWEFK